MNEETVPFKVWQPEKARRLNAGKARVDLIYPGAITAEGQVMAFGAQKYDDNNWKKSLNTDKHDEFVQGCIASMLRHTLAISAGEYLDPESGLPHVAHVRCNAAFIQFYRDNRVGRRKL